MPRSEDPNCPKVLVVEDDGFFMTIVEEILESLGITSQQVTFANNVEKAIAEADRLHALPNPLLALVDTHLWHLDDGFKVLQHLLKLRSFEENRLDLIVFSDSYRHRQQLRDMQITRIIDGKVATPRAIAEFKLHLEETRQRLCLRRVA